MITRLQFCKRGQNQAAEFTRDTNSAITARMLWRTEVVVKVSVGVRTAAGCYVMMYSHVFEGCLERFLDNQGHSGSD